MKVLLLPEFVQLIASEANTISEEDKKKTLNPEHVVKALERMGFSAFSGDVSQFLEEVKEIDKKCKGSSPLPACRNRGQKDLMTAAFMRGSASMVLLRMLVSLLECCPGHALLLSRTMQCRLGDEGESEVQAL